MVYIRKIVQFLILLVILLAAFSIVGQASLTLPWMSRFSPLMTISTRLAARQWTPYFCGGVLIGFLCLLLPRFFCGWLCPVGTCIDIVDTLSFAAKRKNLIRSCWLISFLIFTGFFVASVFGYNAAGYIDPLTITAHTASVLNSDESAVTATSYLAGGISDIRFIMLGIFLAILVLTIFGRRSWCRILCPLGGFLGALATVSLKQRIVGSECIKCGKCYKVCKMGAIDTSFEKTVNQLCIYCNKCQNVCPKDVISFK